MSHQENVRLFFKEQADKEGIPLREWCKNNGIIYDSFFGKEDEELPGKVYIWNLHRPLGVEGGQDSSDDEE